MAMLTRMVDKMKRRERFFRTVVTVDGLFDEFEGIWHRLRGQKGIQHSKICRHVSQTFKTNWTRVISLGVMPVARQMHQVPTTQFLNIQPSSKIQKRRSTVMGMTESKRLSQQTGQSYSIPRHECRS